MEKTISGASAAHGLTSNCGCSVNWLGDSTTGKSFPATSSTLVTSFVHRRVNSTTFVIIEDDIFGEQPYIYVKVFPGHLLITDTGCNRPRSTKPTLTSLREYLENYPLHFNGNEPLNAGGKKHYIIICTHCHYDHILGIPQFLSANPTIVASSFQKSFILKNLPTHSLCKYMNVPTPKYKISHWANHLDYFLLSSLALRLQFLHIPGHTPCSLAYYDLDEHYLYTGDTFYERTPNPPIRLPDDASQASAASAMQGAIIFPEEGGNWIEYMASLGLLLSFVSFKNKELECQCTPGKTVSRVKIGAGHCSYGSDAEYMLLEVKALFEHIIAGKLPAASNYKKRGVVHDFWMENDAARFSVLAPRHLVEEARQKFCPNR